MKNKFEYPTLEVLELEDVVVTSGGMEESGQVFNDDEGWSGYY